MRIRRFEFINSFSGRVCFLMNNEFVLWPNAFSQTTFSGSFLSGEHLRQRKKEKHALAIHSCASLAPSSGFCKKELVLVVGEQRGRRLSEKKVTFLPGSLKALLAINIFVVRKN